MVNITVVIIIAVPGFIVIRYTYRHDMKTGSYAVPFWPALSILGLWNWRTSNAEKAAQESADRP